MIITIARKEITEMLRDGRFRWAAAILLLLLLSALAAGGKYHASVSAQHEAGQAAERERWLNQGEKGPHSAAHYGVYAFKPKNPLALFDSGIESYVGVSTWLEAHSQNEFSYRPADDGTAIQRFGELTAATVLQVLVPLLIILLCFGAFAGERERGTLRQVMSLGVRPRDLVLGKAIGICAVVLLLLLPALAAGVIALMASGTGGSFWTALFPRIALLAVSYSLYLGIFIFISLAVSARVESARFALVILISFWAVNCLIAPRAMADLAAAWFPTPSGVEFRSQIRTAVNDDSEAMAEVQRLQAEMMAEYGVENPEDLPINFVGIEVQAGEEHGYRIYDREFSRLFDTVRQQNRSYQLGSAVAPMLGVQSVSMAFSGTDFEHHRHFVEAAEEYRRVIQKIMNDAWTANPERDGERYLAGPDLWREVPEFSYAKPNAAWAMRHYGPGMFLLIAWFGIALAAALLSAARMKVT